MIYGTPVWKTDTTANGAVFPLRRFSLRKPNLIYKLIVPSFLPFSLDIARASDACVIRYS